MLGATILVIDSDAEATEQIVTTLEAEDFLVFTAQSGDVGFTMAKKVNPSLIFINPAMEGTSGLELCKTIHSMEPLKKIPIVVLSSFEGATDPRYTSMYGIVGSLKKPFTPEELVSKTKSVLSMEMPEAKAPAAFEEKTADVPEEETMGKEEPDFGFGGDIGETIVIEKKAEPEPQKPVTSKMDTFKSIPQKTVAPKESLTPPVKPAKPAKTEEKEDEELAKYIQAPGEESKEDVEKKITRTYTMRRYTRRSSMSNKLLALIIVLIIVMLGSGGFFLYTKGLLPWIGKKAQKTVAVTPSLPVQKEEVKVMPQQEQQQPEQPAEEKKTAAAASTTLPVPDEKQVSKPASKPAPAPIPAPSAKPSAKPETAPAVKVIYSVQIGAFKNLNNAISLTKQYKEKGYEAFTHKSIKGDETIYRVLIGNFADRKEANKLTNTLITREKIKATIFKE